VGYQISEFFGLNRSAREQAIQWHKKVWILKLRARETAEKVRMCQNRGRNQRGRGWLHPSPEKAYSSLVRNRISEIFGLNQSAREQVMQWHKKIWILKLRARETAEKVKMCQN
jgi:hypothetical protein